MAMKFNGSDEEFISKLNALFSTEQSGEKVGNLFRYEANHNNKNYKINLFSNGTVQIQPGNEELYELVEDALSENKNIDVVSKSKKQIFIVHGHDLDSKNALENMLYKWDLKPYAIQDEDSQGKTIIEFLENEIAKHSVGIVLLTGDDSGYSLKAGAESKQPRARQNVILELGMLIGRLGREKCIIIRKSEVEIPSDIDGLIYISFDKKIDEVKDKLRVRLINLGIEIK